MDDAANNPFSSVPNQNPELQSQRIMGDDMMFQLLDKTLSDLNFEHDKLNYLEMIHQRYNVYLAHRPEDQDELVKVLNDLNLRVVSTIIDHYDLMAFSDISSLDTETLNLLARELYSTFMVHRPVLAVEFLSHWLPLNYRRIYDFSNTRCHDVIYVNLKKTHPKLAPLLYKLNDVIHYMIDNDPPSISSGDLMHAFLSRDYDSKPMGFAQMYFGLDGNVAILAIGKQTASRFFNVLTTHHESEIYLTQLYSQLQIKNEKD